MTPLRVFVNRMLALFTARRADAALQNEVQAHLDLLAAAHVRSGLSPQAAREAARRDFGGVEPMKDAYRDQRGLRAVSEIAQDVRHGLRAFRKFPTLTLAIVLTLAIGVCATTTVFTLINVVLLKPLPVADPDRLVLFSVSRTEREADVSFSYPLFQRFRAESKTLARISAQGGPMRLRLGTKSRTSVDMVGAQPVSGSFFSTLGVTAAVGRTITESDDANGPSAVLVLSDRYWARRFGRDPSVIGRSVTLDDTPFVVIGVAPPGFHGYQVGSIPDLWWPIQMLPVVRPEMRGLTQPGNSWLLLMGRLARGKTQEQAQAEMEPVFRSFEDDRLRSRPVMTDAQRQRFMDARLQLLDGSTGWTWLRPQFTQPLWVLMALVSTLLLLACVNIMNLLLSRNVVRQPEMAMRNALGATGGRLVRQLLTECALFAAVGGGIGFLAAQWASRALVWYLPVQPGALDLAPDLRVYAFTLGVTVLTAVLFGVTPAWRAVRRDLPPSINRPRQECRRALAVTLGDSLVVVQVALSVLLVSGAVLFGRTLQNLVAVEPGFVRDGFTLFALDVPGGYDVDRRMTLYGQVREALISMPGVSAVSFSAFGLLGGSGWSEVLDIDGYVPPPGELAASQALLAGPQFVETIGASILYGTDLPPDRVHVALINDTLARRFFSGRDAIGRRFRIRGWTGDPFEIVGVVADTKYRTLREPADAIFYVPFAARPVTLSEDVTFEVRTDGSPGTVAGIIARVVRETDPRVVPTDIKTVGDLLGNSLLQERLVANGAGALGIIALVLASIGLYGVRAHAVTRRVAEIGLRLALGASRSHVFWMIHRRSALLLGLGLAIGLPVSVALSRTLDGLLFGIEPADPWIMIGTALILATVGTLAGLIPAHRATHVDPLTALRRE